jgi:hypothetical protein
MGRVCDGVERLCEGNGLYIEQDGMMSMVLRNYGWSWIFS